MIHGYKKKLHSIKSLLTMELAKSPFERSDQKIVRLEQAKNRCLQTIRTLQQQKQSTTTRRIWRKRK